MSEHELEFHQVVREDPFDPRDRPYPPDDLSSDQSTPQLETALREALSKPVEIPDELWVEDYRELTDTRWYQRGEECTGFALAAIADYHIRKRDGGRDMSPESAASRRMMYEMAQVYDRAEYDTGSTLRGALKGWKRTGVTTEREWPYEPGDEHGEKHGTLTLKRVIDSVGRPGSAYLRIDKTDASKMKDALARGYPLYANADTHVGWINLYLPDTCLIYQPQAAESLGGHAFVIVGYNTQGWWVHNSWGSEWGEGGYGLLPYEDWDANGHDVWFVFPPRRPQFVDLPERSLLPQLDPADEPGERRRARERLTEAMNTVDEAEQATRRAESEIDALETVHKGGAGGGGGVTPEDTDSLDLAAEVERATGRARVAAEKSDAASETAKAVVEKLREDSAGTPGADGTTGDGLADTALADVRRLIGESYAAIAQARAAIDHAADAAAQQMYSTMWRHLVVLGDDGRLMPTGTRHGMNKEALQTLLYLFRQHTRDWKQRRLAIFADGGYWSTPATIELMAPLRDALMEQEIYPIFVLWETPWLTGMQGWLFGEAGQDPVDWGAGAGYGGGDDGVMRNFEDVMMKFLAAEFSAPQIWHQVDRRAKAACHRVDGGARLLADSIAYNLTKASFEVHLIGHGAGDLLLSELAPLLPAPIDSCSLWAPATTMQQFRDTYLPMLDDGCLRSMSLHVLDDAAERSGYTGPVPGSPLMLVSDVLAIKKINLDTAVECAPDGSLIWTPDPVPVLGMQRFLASDAEVKRLRAEGRLSITVRPLRSHTELVVDRDVRTMTIDQIMSEDGASVDGELPAPEPGSVALHDAPMVQGAVAAAPARDPLAFPVVL